MDLRRNITLVYSIIFIGTIFSIVHLFRNTIQFKRIKRTRFQKKALVWYFVFLVVYIGFGTYFFNVVKRFIVQVLLPNKIRAWVFKKFAREK